MGFKTEVNWVLKLKPENGLNEDFLEIGSIYKFFKSDHRIYPVGHCIDLLNQDWEAIGKVIILETTVGYGETVGKYEVVKLFDETEKEFLTNYWREKIEVLVGEKIDFSDYKLS